MLDANTGRVLYEKNAHTALPIASITKLMTALVVLDARQELSETLSISTEDVYLEQTVRSSLGFGMQMSRRDALQLALMSSENRAANMLSRYYPNGKQAFVDAMNRKAKQLGMNNSLFVEGTGLASANVASASDLAKLVQAAKQHPLIRELSTQANFAMTLNTGAVRNFHTTNRLIANPNWDITLQKTGFINADLSISFSDAKKLGETIEKIAPEIASYVTPSLTLAASTAKPGEDPKIAMSIRKGKMAVGIFPLGQIPALQ